jgi:hypothetical protein
VCRGGVTVLFLACVNVVECELWQGIEEKIIFVKCGVFVVVSIGQ